MRPSRALTSEPARTAALYGSGQAKERLGDAKAARELYARAHQSVEPVSVTVEAGNVNEVLVRIPTKRLDP